jgi:hypothetical protein
MKIGYFDCFAGASGDMILASMLDAGLDERFLVSQIKLLGLEGVELKVERRQRSGIGAAGFEVLAPAQKHHRNLADIRAIISQSGISESARGRAIAIFEKLAGVEGAIHGKKADEITFHEIGAVDSIVDIVGVCVGFEALGIEKICCSQLCVGSGVINCAHGKLPAPSPATTALLQEAGAPVVGKSVGAELLTPTGAAILTNLCEDFGAMPAMRIESVGYGAGSRQFDEFANVLRLIIGNSAEENDVDTDCVCLLETNVDDATGEMVGFVSQLLLDKGAVDVFTTAIGMKYNRPAVKLSVLCRPGDGAKMEKILFKEGLTLGIRKQFLQRSKLRREIVAVDTEFGRINIKQGILNSEFVCAKPEYSDCAEAAKRHGVSLKSVIEAAKTAFALRKQG